MGKVLSDRYWAFQTYAWDLGGFNQGMWTTVFSGRLFYYTADLPSGNPGSLLASHFSPILFLLLPFYVISPTPAGLLVIQEAGVAVGVIPLYYLASRLGLSNFWVLVVQAAYLASPVLMGIGWYDFHAEAFLPATVLLAVYCYYFAGRWAFVASWLLCLSVIETISPLLFLFALASVIALAGASLKHHPQSRQIWLKSVLALAIVPVWIGIAELFNLVVLHTTLGTLGTSYSSVYSTLGSNLSFLAVVPYALVHPAAAIRAVETDGIGKLAYVLIMFGSLAFVPLLGPKRLLLPAIAWFILAILSNGGSLVEFGNQTAAYGFAFLVAGFPFGLSRLQAYAISRPAAENQGQRSSPILKPRARRWRRAARPVTGLGIVSALVVTTLVISPLQTEPSWSYADVPHGVSAVTPHDIVLHQIIGLIPSSASVLTDSALFPEVSSRIDAYVDPISSGYRPNLTYVEALNNYVNESRFVLLDFDVGFFDSSFIIRYANLSGFGIFAEEDQIILFERGWTGAPSLWVPFQGAFCGDQLGRTQYSHTTPSATPGCSRALSTVASPPIDTLLWFGPYIYGLSPGRYSVTYWISVTAQSAGGQIRLYTLSYPLALKITQNGLTSEPHTYGFEMSSTGNQSLLNSTVVQNPGPGPSTTELNVTLTFDWGYLSCWGVAGWVFASGTQTTVYEVTLHQLSV